MDKNTNAIAYVGGGRSPVSAAHWKQENMSGSVPISARAKRTYSIVSDNACGAMRFAYWRPTKYASRATTLDLTPRSCASLYLVRAGKAWTIALFGGMLLAAMALERGVLAVFRAIGRERPKD